MIRTWMKGLGLILIMLLIACNAQSPQTQPNQNEQNNPYRQLSNNNQEQETPQYSQQNQESLQQKLPEESELDIDESEDDSEENQQLEGQGVEGDAQPDTQEPGQESIPSTKLSFEDFQARWNATSEEQLSNLYIEDFEKVSTAHGQAYRTMFRKQLELRVYVEQDHIQTLEMVGGGNDQAAVFAMLSGWAQIINIFHPEIEIYDVDSKLADIGVGPNGDLSNVKESTFTYEGVQYKVIPEDSQYTFRGTYVDN